MYERLSLIVNHVNRRVAVATAIVITTLLIVDLLATRQILFFESTWQSIIFVLTIVVAYGIGSLILLIYVRKTRTTEFVEKRNHFMNIVYFGVVVVQFSLFAILISILVDNSVSCPGYPSLCMTTRPLATSINVIASTGAGVILGIISFKFFHGLNQAIGMS
jgi:amino acid transporter